MASGWEFWVDRGGTFTDVIARSPEGELQTAKLLSDDPSQYTDAIGEAIRRLLPAGEHVAALRLGTTVATNALLTRRGARTALLVTEGFADLLVIGHQQRPDLFALAIKKPAPLYERVVEVAGRLAADGSELLPLDNDALRTQLADLRADGIDALAISLLHGYRNPTHERCVAALAAEAGFTTVRCSSSVSGLIRYVERTSTTVLDAYLSPVVADYLGRLHDSLRTVGAPPVAVMHSNGGLATTATTSGRNTILSGPAGGVVGMARAAAEIGIERLIGFDMGGTSTDVCAYDGALPLTYDAEIAGIAITEPQVAIHTIAAGGGSVLDCADGRLQVGPASAGADPGPAAYRKGGPATVTDANVVLGRLPADALPAVFGAGANEPISITAAEQALDALVAATNAASEAATDRAALAAACIDIAVEHMANAIRQITLARGTDPADYTLAVFGGAGAQHCCAVAERIGAKQIWLHPLAGVLSALGVGVAPFKRTRTLSIEAPLARCAGALDERAETAMAALLEEWPQEAGPADERRTFVGLRYGRSNAVIESRLADARTLRDEFAAAYRQRFGATPEEPIDVAYLRIEVAAAALAAVPSVRATTMVTAATTERVYDGSAWCDVPRLAADAIGSEPVTGPAIIVGPHTTLWLARGWRVAATTDGAWLLTHTSAVASERTTARNPHLLEVFNGRFMAIAERMGKTLQRTAQSVNIRERLDYSCAVFDRAGRLLANAPHMPVHLGSMSESVRVAMERFAETAQDGDVWVLNSPYDGGTHLPDITVVAPWFDTKQQLSFFTAARAHHADVGGTTPGSMPADSAHIDEEGVLIECRELLRAGEPLFDALLADWAASTYPPRQPTQNVADLRAQCAALLEGARGLADAERTFGRDVLLAYAGYVHDNAAETVARVVTDIGDGASVVPMDNGSEIHVAVSQRGARLAISFAGTSAQVDGNFNAPPAVCRAAVLYVLRCLVDRPIPLNDGCLTAIDLDIPSGSVLAPRYPAAVVAGNVETSQAITDALLLALGAAAASQGTMNNLTFGDGTLQYYETIAGGAGAGPGFDGADAVHTHMTNSRLTDPEVFESRYPVRLERFAVRADSGGDGQHRGGNGVVRTLRFLAPVDLSLLSGRRRNAPPGLGGGSPGQVGVNRVLRANGSSEVIAAVWRGRLDAGDAIEIATPGGGGAGP
ncbi:MAG: hydantoinase B/oxoprolinase family protein [Pseudomonadota bacterium]